MKYKNITKISWDERPWYVLISLISLYQITLTFSHKTSRGSPYFLSYLSLGQLARSLFSDPWVMEAMMGASSVDSFFRSICRACRPGRREHSINWSVVSVHNWSRLPHKVWSSHVLSVRSTDLCISFFQSLDQNQAVEHIWFLNEYYLKETL